VPSGDAGVEMSQYIAGVIERTEVVAAHRELVEASDAVRHLLVVEDLTQEKIDRARERLARAYQRADAVDEALCASVAASSSAPGS
jgi:hypothetical protein